jgi:hypothetical protein
VNTALVGLAAGYSYGWEKDYRSHTLSASARGDFLERNFTLGLAYTRNFDSVCDQNNQNAQGPLDLLALASSENCFKVGVEDVVERKVATHTFEPSLVWTATPRLLLQGGGTLQVIDGFQSSPTAASSSAARAAPRKSTSPRCASATPCSRGPAWRSPRRAGRSRSWPAPTATPGTCAPPPPRPSC